MRLGSDNVEARQWLNATLVDLVRFDSSGAIEPSTVIPLIDGGTEGFGGQARVFLPRLTSCFECSLPSMPPQQGFAVCTIRNIPRLPEHCVLYALKVEWPLLERFDSPSDYKLYERAHSGDDHSPAAVALDKDDAAHMTWLYERARQRAAQFGIGGVTYALTMQVVKNIIPAIASTNALIAAACVNECWKARTNAALRLDNYFMSAHRRTSHRTHRGAVLHAPARNSADGVLCCARCYACALCVQVHGRAADGHSLRDHPVRAERQLRRVQEAAPAATQRQPARAHSARAVAGHDATAARAVH